jgi:hypothetical protein
VGEERTGVQKVEPEIIGLTSAAGGATTASQEFKLKSGACLTFNLILS